MKQINSVQVYFNVGAYKLYSTSKNVVRNYNTVLMTTGVEQFTLPLRLGLLIFKDFKCCEVIRMKLDMLWHLNKRGENDTISLQD